jgi:hypothetical protein
MARLRTWDVSFGALPAFAALVFAAVSGVAVTASAAEVVTIEISVRDHQFTPAEIHGPANTAMQIHVKNLDSGPMEFESVPLRVEKVVTGNGEGIINVRPLAPGRYTFFDDFHQQTTGALVVESK